MLEIFAGIALIILAKAVYQYVEQRTKHSVSNKAEKRLTARIEELDRRLTDIQDVMISLDEKFDRSPVGL